MTVLFFRNFIEISQHKILNLEICNNQTSIHFIVCIIVSSLNIISNTRPPPLPALLSGIVYFRQWPWMALQENLRNGRAPPKAGIGVATPISMGSCQASDIARWQIHTNWKNNNIKTWCLHAATKHFRGIFHRMQFDGYPKKSITTRILFVCFFFLLYFKHNFNDQYLRLKGYWLRIIYSWSP